MIKKIDKVVTAKVLLWGKEVGAIAWDEGRRLATFEYEKSFLGDGFNISPLTMPREPGIFSFPELNPKTFYGLPGLLADSIPDKFGNTLIDTWLAREGRSTADFSPVERLCYIGSRGMGALEFKPSLRPSGGKSVSIEIDKMIELAQLVVDNRSDMLVNLQQDEAALDAIIRIGTSAGGARAKALIGWNRRTNDVRSGQVPLPKGFEPWIMKFDGVDDKSIGQPQGYGRVEFTYHTMAVDAGIEMSPSHLFEENGRAHFMTKRFDRGPSGERIHMQSLCALGHYDFNMAGAIGYEQAFEIILKLNLGYETLEEMYRRMVFNIVARNQDDHTKNIAFLMSDEGTWRLAPAFDIIWAYSMSGPWTSVHQMSVNGKRDNFTRSDLATIGRQYGIKNGPTMIEEVIDVVSRWRDIARSVGVPESMISRIASTHRLKMD